MGDEREVVDTITITWAVVLGPIPCDCGHDHYGRVPDVQPRNEWIRHLDQLAPQWSICEDPTCGCTSLRHTASTNSIPLGQETSA